MIKTQEQINGIRRSGELNTAVLDRISEEIRAGVSTAHLDRLVYEKTVAHGGFPATLGYEGFQ